MIAITIPQGYHAGFSHGFTLAESSNFALTDWIRIGSKAAEKYRWLGCWESLIEIDELLFTLCDNTDKAKASEDRAQQPTEHELALYDDVVHELTRRIKRE